MKPVLRIPVYRRLLAAYALNELAFMVGTVALALLVYRRTGSALGATAFFLASQFVPALISPMAVARLDQLSARVVLPVLHWIEAAIFLLLAWVASDHFSVGAVLALAFLDGILALTARALTRAATVSVTGAAGLLRDGNAVSNAAFSICFMFGPGLGGALVAAGSTSLALLANAAIFGVCGLVLVTARGLPEPAPERGEAKGRVRAALAYAREVPEISRLLLLQAIGVLFFTISVPVEVVFAQHSLHAGAAGYGGMVSAWGAGAVAGAAVYARWRGRPNRELIVGGAASLALGFVVMAAAPTLAVAIVGAALGGVGNGIESVAARTALQEEASESWMAMMMSLYEALFQSVPGAGMLIGGGITALGSPRTALAVAGAGSLAVTVGAWFALSGLGSRLTHQTDGAQGTQTDGAPAPQPEATREPQVDGRRTGALRDAPRTPAVRHQ